jgi:hypothetical protein
MRSTSPVCRALSSSAANNPELATVIVVSGVLNAWANPSSKAARKCSECRSASRFISTANDLVRSIAIAVTDAIELMLNESIECS